jgi:hypothetical protein
MTGHAERRRRRTCPSCRGTNVIRGPKVGGLAIPLPHTGEGGKTLTADAYADVCYDCGMVTMFVRLSETVRARALESAADATQ